MSSKPRLDQYLVDQKFFPSRARARDAILRGTVKLGGVVCLKPAQKVAADASVTVADPAAGYVSRAALKLIAGLNDFHLSPRDKICLDIGASTGGFTQVLLERGARKVHAIDVGHDQLHDRLKADPRVVAQDGLNARDLTSGNLQDDAPELIVSDVSFISLKLALPPALDIAAPGAHGVFLVKPQFEAGRKNIGKGGLVDPYIAAEAAQMVQSWLQDFPGWVSGALLPSPVKGGDGNSEWLLHGTKSI